MLLGSMFSRWQRACRRALSTPRPPLLHHLSTPRPPCSITARGTRNHIKTAICLQLSNIFTLTRTPMSAAAPLLSQRSLLRHFIAASLYDKKHGYFCKGDTGRKIGRVAPLPFAAMSGRAEFQARAAKLYDGLAHSWLTPSELFSPFYGAAVARWAAEHVTGLRHVIEVGPGNGTFAIDFLDTMKLRYPSLYSSLRYTAVDASLSHARTLASTLKVHERARAVNMDFRQWEEERGSAEGTLVIMCEVLDNMPHDKVRISSSIGGSGGSGGSGSSGSSALAAHVFTTACSSLSSDPSAQWTSNPDGPFVETFSPSNDVTITRLLQLLSPSPPPLPLMTRDIYLPTSMFGILEMMAERLQGAALFVADFHHLDDTLSRPLPPLPSSFSLPHLTSWLKKSGKSVASLPAINAPVVVLPTYLQPLGSCDIMFPTDFQFLSRMDKHFSGAGGDCRTHREFFALFGDLEATRTRDGFNPVMEEYSYQSVYCRVS